MEQLRRCAPLGGLAAVAASLALPINAPGRAAQGPHRYWHCPGCPDGWGMGWGPGGGWAAFIAALVIVLLLLLVVLLAILIFRGRRTGT